MIRQCVVLAAPRRIEVVAEALPPAKPGQLLVRTEVSAISPGTEMLFYRGQVPTYMPVDAALDALGHNGVQYPLRYGYSCVVFANGMMPPQPLQRRGCGGAQ